MRFHREFMLNPMIVFVMFVFVLNAAVVCLNYQGMRTWTGIFIGMIVFATMEYLIHRFLLHQFPRIAPFMHRGHAEHHRHPEDANHLFSAVPYDAIAYFAFSSILYAVTRDWFYTCAVITGASLYQLYYQWMHYAAHRPITPITPWGRWMKKKHLIHHYLDENAWYGVSHPVLDFIFGTDKPRNPSRNYSAQSKDYSS